VIKYIPDGEMIVLLATTITVFLYCSSSCS